jgi:hypothetical protein
VVRVLVQLHRLQPTPRREPQSSRYFPTPHHFHLAIGLATHQPRGLPPGGIVVLPPVLAAWSAPRGMAGSISEYTTGRLALLAEVDTRAPTGAPLLKPELVLLRAGPPFHQLPSRGHGAAGRQNGRWWAAYQQQRF